MRCLSILVTWLLALGLVYLLFSILIPELVASVSLLFSVESYYRTIYTWVTQLVRRQSLHLRACAHAGP